MTADDPATSPTVARGRFPWFGDSPRTALLAWFLLAAIVLLTGVPQVLSAQPMSPFDEATHVDYALQSSTGQIPFRGGLIEPEILAEWSCFGQRNVELPECGTTAPASDFPARGENYNFGHPPTYYAPTGLVARALTTVAPDLPFTIAVRFAGLPWLLGGAIVLYAALRRFAVPAVTAFAGASLAIVWGPHFSLSTSASNDAPALLAAALALHVIARVLIDRNYGWLMPLLVSGLLTSTKAMHGIVFLAVAAMFVVLVIASRRSPLVLPARVLAVAAALALPVPAVLLAWTVVQSRRGAADWVSPINGASNRPFEGLPFDEWSTTLFGGFVSFGPATIGSTGDTFLATSLLSALIVIVAMAPWVLLALVRGRGARASVAVAALIGLLAYPLAVQVQVFANSGGEDWFPLVSARYGVALNGLLLACLAFLAHELRLERWLWGIAGVAVLLTFVDQFV